MTGHRQDKLVEKYPSLFCDIGKERTSMIYGITCGDGWYELIEQACEFMSRPEFDGIQPKFNQIKEKFGQLRMYTGTRRDHGDPNFEITKEDAALFDQINDCIDKLEAESFKVCEDCGSRKLIKTAAVARWIRTLCNDCMTVAQGGPSSLKTARITNK